MGGKFAKNEGEFLKIEIVTELTTTLWGRMRKSLQKKNHNAIIKFAVGEQFKKMKSYGKIINKQ